MADVMTANGITIAKQRSDADGVCRRFSIMLPCKASDAIMRAVMAVLIGMTYREDKEEKQ